MSDLSLERLWARLVEQKLVSGEMTPLPHQQSPWFVRVMLGFAGWIGALFLLAFVGVSLSFIVRSAGASLVAGALVCIGAAVLFRVFQGKDFAVQFGLAVSFAGQALFIYGLMETFRWEGGMSYLYVMTFEAVLAAVVANEIHRAASAFAAAISLSLFLWWYGVPYLAPAIVTAAVAVVWLHEFPWADHRAVQRPIGYSLVLAALYCNGILLLHGYSWLLRHGGVHSVLLARLSYWTGVLVIGAVFLITVYRLAKREGLGINDGLTQTALLAALATAVVSYKAPGIAAGLVIVLIGFANANRVLAGLGVFFLISYLSLFYYQLQATLLTKSISLVATGIVLLVARLALGRFRPAADPEGASHA